MSSVDKLKAEKDQACLQANWFAFSFLMPEKEFREQWNKHSGNLWALSEYFGVTRRHATLRARMLNLSN